MAKTVRSIRLGRELRDGRERSGLTHQGAITQLGWSRAKLDRIESGETIPKLVDLHAALDLYSADSGKRAMLAQLRGAAKQRGWWAAYNDVFTGSYVALEWDAARVFEFQLGLIPGLLQTQGYARAVISAAHPKSAPDRIDRAVQARMARRTLVTRQENPPHLHCVIDEGVLRRQVGGRDVLRSQVSHLWEMSRRPNVTIQILPFSAGAHAASEDSFIKLTFPDDDLPPVAYIEGLGGELYLESPLELQRITLAEEGAVNASLGPDESAVFLAALANEE